MNRDQSYALIRQTFTQGFDKARFQNFAVNLLNRIDESKAQAWNNTYVKDAFKNHVSRYERLGTYTSPDSEKLDVLIVHLTSETKQARARTAIRNFVAHHLKTRDEKEAALVAFVSPTEKQWRFSYVKMEYITVEKESGKVGVETRLTPARRFSYIVGEGESCHTAQTRFLPLLQDTKTDPKLADIEEAFSVEAVTKEFFKRYVELFENIHQALDKIIKKDNSIHDEFQSRNVNTVDFAKKLMGQIVFLYFLQKKGWLGVEKGKDWGTGPHDFLRHLAGGEYGAYDNYFNDVLEPLFYDTLATDRGHEAWCNCFHCRIPFLNGGLFEALGGYDWRKTDILLPNRLFTNNDPVEEGITGTGVLDVFDRYNFTVNEAEPLEKEVAIDPEMLGKVFENLIEENRRKGLGAYYTPREIVHYMCRESLINYLDTALNKEKELVPRKDIETFIHTGDQAAHYEAARMSGTKTYQPELSESIETHARLIDDKLQEITVCDPAVGSGAFPVGMMTEIVRARSALTPYFNDVHERTPYFFKRHAIQNCLYGVDIDPGAVEIAKLRLWLSLVVDEEDVKQIKPLPNLDYKIVAGNSLLGVEKNLFNNEQFKRLEALKPKFFNETDQKLKAKLKEQIEALIHDLTNGRETFDFEIYFSEVFHANKGFDVVIANPPYVSVEKFARTAQQAEWKRRFKTYASRCDIYCFFYERGLGLLRMDGVLTFISSNKFQRAGYGKGLREFLACQRIQALMDFCELPVFAAATDPMIAIVIRGAPPEDHQFPVVVIKDEAEFGSLTKSLSNRGTRYKLEQLKADGWSLEGGAGLKIIEKLRAKGVPLGDYPKCRIMAGIKTGYNKAFWISAEAARQFRIENREAGRQFVKPLLTGDDARRWITKPVTSFLIYTPRGTSEKELGPLKDHIVQWRSRLEQRALDQKWYELQQAQQRYSQTYEKPKIIYPDIALEPRFSLDTLGRYPDMTAFSIPLAEQWLVAMLNSKVLWFFLCRTAAVLGDADNRGRVRCKTQYVSRMPIPPLSYAEKSRLTKLAERAAEQAKGSDEDGLRKTEREIDEIVYRLFELTPGEIAIVEGKQKEGSGR